MDKIWIKMNFIQMLSKCYPNAIQIVPKSYPNLIQILSRFYQKYNWIKSELN